MNLKFDNNNDFELNLTYGESKPNTLDFKNTGHKQINGTYLINNKENNHFKEVYQLKSDALSENIVLVKNK